MRNFAPFLLILFLIAAVLRIDFFFTIAYLFFAIYLLSRVWTRRTTVQMKANRRFTDHAFCGDQVPVEVIVQNNGRLPVPWLEIHESIPVDLASPASYREALSLGGREQHRFHYTLNCRKRGYYALGPLTMHTGDLLGVVKTAQMELASQYIVVYPRVLPLQKLGLPTHSPLVALPARTPLFEDPARVIGVRDYQHGDSPRRIHWTATANAGRLLVKRYQPAIARETLICLDLDQGDYGQRQRYMATEMAIVTAASIANHVILKERLPTGLVTLAFDPLTGEETRFYLPPRKERAHLMSLLEVLARVQVETSRQFVDSLRRESANLSWGATITVITGRESEDLYDTLVYLRRAGFAVSLILVQPARASAEMEKRSALLGTPVHRVWNERDLEALQ